MDDPTGGSEPTNCAEVRAAIAKCDSSNERHKRYLTKKAIDLGCVNDIPDDWTMEVSNGD
jgi:hypothetical protein